MIKREMEDKLIKQSKQFPVVTVTGPRQSGKTTICKKVFNNYKYVNLEYIENRDFALNDPKGFLKIYSGGVIIDEVQRAPDLLSYIQELVDINNTPGEFILTGSYQFELVDKINQSLAGRTAMLKLLPLSISELLNHYKDGHIEKDLLMYQGFYPRIYDKNIDSYDMLSFYINTYVEKDLRQLINIKNLSTFNMFLKLCAGRSGQILNLNSLSGLCGISVNTVKSWISILEASFIIFKLQPYYKNFNKRLIKSPKLYFYDTGLMCNLLGIKDKNQIITHPLKGEIFETMIVSEIIKQKFNKQNRFDMFYFRDSNGNEVDLVLETNASTVAIEVKSSCTFNSSYLKGIKFFSTLSKEPIKGIVVYGGEDSYTRENCYICSYRNISDEIG